MASAVFESQDVARRWNCLSKKLNLLWETKATSKDEKLRHICNIREEMSTLIPYARNVFIQKVSSFIKPDYPLNTTGHWIYALICPYWGKIYVGATGFSRPRTPVERWTEHVRLAKLWRLSKSSKRYMPQIPALYLAYGKTGIGNVIMVILERVGSKTLRTTRETKKQKMYKVQGGRWGKSTTMSANIHSSARKVWSMIRRMEERMKTMKNHKGGGGLSGGLVPSVLVGKNPHTSDFPRPTVSISWVHLTRVSSSSASPRGLSWEPI
jgi:hypothetical protein